jgi:hypothetical protein
VSDVKQIETAVRERDSPAGAAIGIDQLDEFFSCDNRAHQPKDQRPKTVTRDPI